MTTTWNPADKSANITLSGGNLIATWNGSAGGVRSTTSNTSGKLYFEVTWNAIDASARCGLANSSLSTGAPSNTANVIWAQLDGAFIQGNGNASLASTGGSMNTGDTAGIAVDLVNELFWYRPNAAALWNANSSNNPATGVGGVSFSYLTGALFLYLGSLAGSAGQQITANFGVSTFAGAVPSGFSAWDPGTLAYTLPASQGAYALTGKPQAFAASLSMAAAKGTYTLTGQASTSLKGHGFIAAGGVYALTGNPQVLRQAGFGAVRGSYALSPQAATLAIGVPGAQGSYALAGKTVAFPVHLSLLAASGRYTLSGFSPSGGGGSGPPFSGRHSLEFIADVAPGMTVGSEAGGASSPPAFTYPGAPLALYSLRKVGAGYAGNCLQVQKIGAGATLNVGFDANGVVDKAAIAAFGGGSSIGVSIWYDQSGNGRNLASQSGDLKPQINLINGHPWLSFLNSYPMGTASAVTLTGDQTIGLAAQLGSNLVAMPTAQFDGSNGWFWDFNGSGSAGTVGASPGVFQYFSTGNGVAVPDTGRYFAKTNRYAVKRASGTATLYVNGSSTKSSASTNNAASSAVLGLGGNVSSPSFGFCGLIGEAYVYASALSDADRLAIDASMATAFPDTGFSTPYSGASSVEFDYGQQIVCGNILAYERTASWTVFAAIQLHHFPSNASVIYTNVPGSGTAFPGHEIWIDTTGVLRVRLIHDYAAPNFIGRIGTTNVIDGEKHMIAYSYDGSSMAAGIKVYVDGVPETTTVESDTLTGSLIGAGQSLWVGNQQGASVTNFNIGGVLSYFQIDNVARSAAYIAPIKNGATPTVDANTDLCLPLNEGSGTTAGDTSGHSRNGALASASMWAP